MDKLTAQDITEILRQITKLICENSDKLCELDLLAPVLKRLGKRATLYTVEGGDHGFHVPKKTGRTDDEALQELAETTAAWIEKQITS